MTQDQPATSQVLGISRSCQKQDLSMTLPQVGLKEELRRKKPLQACHLWIQP